MKNFNNKLGIAGWVLIIAAVAMGAKIGGDILRIGAKTGTDIEIRMGDGRVKWDDVASKMQFSNDLGGSFKDIGAGGGGAGGFNMLTVDDNPGFEDGSPPDAWTSSGGTFVSESGVPLFQLSSGKWDPSANGQNLDSNLKAVPIGLEGRTCLVLIEYLWDSGVTGEIKLQVLDSGDNVDGRELDLKPTTGIVRPAFFTFTCESSESHRLRLTSTADAAEITIDQAFLGENTKATQVGATTLFLDAVWPAAANCIWTVTSTSMGSFPIDNDCPSPTIIGNGTAPSTSLPRIDIPSLPKGKYLITYSARFNPDSGSCSFTFQLGGVNTHIMQRLVTDNETLTWAGSVDIPADLTGTFAEFQAERNSATTCRLSNNSPPDESIHFQIIRMPTESTEALTLEIANFGIRASLSGNNFNLGTSVNATYVSPTNGGMTLTQDRGASQIACASGTESSGTTCTAADENAGISFSIPIPGIYRVCTNFSHVTVAKVLDANFKLAETNNSDHTIIQDGEERAQSKYDTGVNDFSMNVSIDICGDFDFANIGKKTIRVFHNVIAVSSVAAHRIDVSNTDNDTFTWKIDLISENFVGLFVTEVVGKVDTGSAIGTRLYTAFIQYSGGVPSVTRQDGTAISSITDNGTGDSTVNYSGLFSSSPNVSVTCVNSSGVVCNIDPPGIPSTTSVGIRSRNSNGGAHVDADYFIMMVGPR